MDDRQFDALVRAHSPALVTFASSLTRDRWSAEDAVQNTLVRAWKYIDSFDGRGSFEGWLLRICRNVITDQANAAAKRPLAVGAQAIDLASDSTPLDASHDINELLQSLPRHQAEVLVIVGVLGYSYEEAANLLSIPIGTVRSRLTRGREAFAALLEATQTSDGSDGKPQNSRAAS